ncbi:MAG: methanogenic corrinoid protein MtbC1 [Myxococcota bacterium]
MSQNREQPVESLVSVMTIGAISRATDIPANTLRTWERRYGFPSPLRSENNQRLYAAELVPHLILIGHALARGHRPKQVMAMSRDQLRALVRPRPPTIETHSDWQLSGWLDAARSLDGAELERGFRTEYARLGTMRFLEDRVAPFIEGIGRAWQMGEIDVFHEHFASERLRTFMSSVWCQLTDRAIGSPVVCTTLPGERHDLGLHMAAAVLSTRARRVVFLGADTPLSDIEACATVANAVAVVVSVSPFSDPDTARENIAALRVRIPDAMRILVGGGGAPSNVPGVDHLGTLTELANWADTLPA